MCGLVVAGSSVATLSARENNIDDRAYGRVPQYDEYNRQERVREPGFGDGRYDDAGDDQARGSRTNQYRRGRRGMRMLRRFDSNRDGTVTRAEFAQGVMRRFERLDVNGDGQITQDELASLRGRSRSATRQY